MVWSEKKKKRKRKKKKKKRGSWRGDSEDGSVMIMMMMMMRKMVCKRGARRIHVRCVSLPHQCQSQWMRGERHACWYRRSMFEKRVMRARQESHSALHSNNQRVEAASGSAVGQDEQQRRRELVIALAGSVCSLVISLLCEVSGRGGWSENEQLTLSSFFPDKMTTSVETRKQLKTPIQILVERGEQMLVDGDNEKAIMAFSEVIASGTVFR